MAERPKMRPYIGSMQSKLAETLQIESTSINIKAKTNEGLDAIGRGEAIGAQAVVLLACRSAR
jgi:2-C-methyl-D-erythritol 2,4-cyclodiphosphate synthase